MEMKSNLESIVDKKLKEQQIHTNKKQVTKNKIAYCHFGSRRPKGEKFGIFSCCIYSDKYGLNMASQEVRAERLWDTSQYITYCQSYWFALRCIQLWQGQLLNVGVTSVMLVTANRVLNNWINNPKSSNKYYKWMNKANQEFISGGRNEIYLTIGLMKPMPENATKYCQEDLVSNKYDLKKFKGLVSNNTINYLDIGDTNLDTIKINSIDGLDNIKELN